MKTHISTWLTASAFLCLLAVHVVSPWLHGAELVWELSLIAIITTIGLVFLVLGKAQFFAETKQVQKPLLVLLLWLLYLGIYLIPIPMELLSIISPQSAYYYQLNTNTDYGYLSLSTSTSSIEWFELTTLVMLFLLTYVLLKRPQRLSKLVYCLLIVASATALYSLVNHYTGGQYQLSKAIPPWDSDWNKVIRGTFSYKNQYAIYLAMSIPLALGLTFDVLKKRKKNWQHNRLSRALIYIICSRIFVYLCIALLLFFVLTKTDSRGGNLVFMLVICGICARYIFWQQQKLNKRKSLLSIFGVIVVLGLIFVNSNSFERFEKYGFSDSSRSNLHSVALSVIADFPLFGSGPGTYPLIQHHYKPESLGNSEMSKRAHNDYLETLATQGIVGILIFSIAILLMLKKVFMGKSSTQQGLLMGCQASLLMLLLHSSFDYNVATFYLSALFFTLLAIGLRLVEPSKRRGSASA
ncbi:O-antigen ligase family protein [Aliiglaciecola sp. 3_MG-2023]|uniref:O-antigen ligase family protein n=1 Tax=Aliiglaciecola sp. 3_MG-2023 TaxID=3062644 RepID=UPI0026E414D1|nr:O-antigen ligase family protein [Aliiglaciecola sp. 3_MG-2023]MDO6693236.1 O-antigen ligase family protein [Aliiglaciecola sp. 3_MG-2023]